MPLNTKMELHDTPHVKVGRNKSYFTSDPLNGDNKYTANDICKMIEFFVDNIYVRLGGQLFRQMVGIPMGTNCDPLLADLFLYSYENEFLDKLIKVGDKSLIIHKSAYNLFSLLISKRGFPSLQTRKTFGKIMSGNYRFLIPVIRVVAQNCEFLLH